jgi:hypothetical protein
MDPTVPAATKKGIVVALVALTLVAFVERWAGLRFLLPHSREADTAIVHIAALHDLPAGKGPNDAAYASTIYTFLFSNVLIALPGSNYPVAPPPGATLEQHLDAAAEPYMRARRLIALLSLLVVPCTYLIARRFLEPWWSVFATALVTTSLLGLEMAQQAKPHGGLAGTTALALVAVLGILRSSSIRAYLFAGVACALALGSLLSGAFVLPSLAIAHLAAWRADRERKRWIGLALAALLCAGGFVYAYPFLVFHDPLKSESKETLNLGQQTLDWRGWKGEGFPDMLPQMWAHEPALVVLVLCALLMLVVGLARRTIPIKSALRPETLVVALHALILIVMFGVHERFYPRYLVPALPAFAVFGAWFVRAICTMLGALTRSTTTWRAISITVALLVLALPAWASAHFAMLRARDDTAIVAARWIEANLPRDSGPIAIDFLLAYPLLQDRAAIKEAPAWAWQPWQRYQIDVMPELDSPATTWNLRPIFKPGIMADQKIDRGEVLDRLAQLDAQWAVVAVPNPVDAARDETCAALRERYGEPVARILPFGPGGSIDSILTRDVDPQFLAHMLTLDRLGPPIEVFKLR